ncbi:bacteriophage holin, partial [archaeon]|nr:bacteriophage holin [archaeon]
MLNPKALALAIGLPCGLYMFLLGILAMNGWSLDIVTMIGTLYFGYDASPAGALVGFVWGFVDGAIAGAIIAAVYNKVERK